MFLLNVQVPVMIQRLHELQTQQAKSHSSQDLGERRNERDEESNSQVSKAGSKPLSVFSSAQKNGVCGGSSGSSSTRLLPDFIYQASMDPSPRETEDRGGKRRELQENGRKAKQKLNFTSSKTEEDVEKNDSSEQPTQSSSWSEVSSMVIGSEYRLSPLSPAMEQRLILQYLTPLGDYQEVRPASVPPAQHK